MQHSDGADQQCVSSQAQIEGGKPLLVGFQHPRCGHDRPLASSLDALHRSLQAVDLQEVEADFCEPGDLNGGVHLLGCAAQHPHRDANRRRGGARVCQCLPGVAHQAWQGRQLRHRLAAALRLMPFQGLSQLLRRGSASSLDVTARQEGGCSVWRQHQLRHVHAIVELEAVALETANLPDDIRDGQAPARGGHQRRGRL